MPTTNGIPPISDYAHWNEDAERMWYEENKYDMLHPEVFETYNDDLNYDWDDEIPEDKCWEINRHGAGTSGFDRLFGPNADIIVQSNDVCSDCKTELVCFWVPDGYSVVYDSMVVYREGYTQTGRKHYWTDKVRFPVYERIAS